MKKQLLYVSSLVFLFLFSACAPHIDLDFSKETALTIHFDSSISATAQKLITRLSESENKDFQLINDTDLKNEFIKNNLTLKDIQHHKDGGVAILAKSSAEHAILKKLVSRSNHQITIKLNSKHFSQLLSLLPPETKELLDLLMAPALSGESMSIAEYKEIMAAFYGEELSHELEKSVVTIGIQCQKKITNAKLHSITGTVTTNKQKALISLKLIELLTLQTAIECQLFY